MKRIKLPARGEQPFLLVVVVVYFASLVAAKLGIDPKALGEGDILFGLFALMRQAEVPAAPPAAAPIAAPSASGNVALGNAGDPPAPLADGSTGN